MADFVAGREQFKKQADSPAAPSGMAQVSDRLARDQELWIDQGRKGLQPWAPQDSMMQVAPQWYAGANAEGTENGWNTDFYNQMMRQTQYWEQKAFDEERSSLFYSQFDPGANVDGYAATGVVTWDDERKDLTFGDIFVNGKKQGNVYDTFDRQTADVMMSDFTLGREEKARAFNELRRNPEAISLAVNQVRQENADRAFYAPQVEQFQDDVEARKDEYKGWQDNALILAAGGAGALQGVGFGSFAGPVGMLVGGAVGFGLGLLGGYVNQDDLVETTARAALISERANEHYQGTDQIFGGVGNWLEQFGGVSTRLMNVTQNLTRGVSEVVYGDIRDDVVAFNDLDADGNRKAAGWMQVLDVGATLADGLIQFSNPVGKGMYVGTMGMQVSGGLGQLVVGEGWNEARADFDPYETRQEWVGAIGSTMIDAIQMGTPLALGKAAQASRASALQAEAKATGQRADDLATASAPSVLGRVSDEPLQYTTLRGVKDKVTRKVVDKVLPERTRDWLARNADDEVLNGLRFRRDANGKVVKVSPTLQLLAPSEFLRMVPTSYLARQARSVNNGVLNLDDYYNAALSMTRAGSRWRDALITGYGEAGEEFIQAAFDPMSLGEDLDPQQMAWAAAYGFAGGVGMGLGTLNKRATSEEVVNNRARLLWGMRISGNPPTDAEWKEITKGMTKSEIEKLAVATPKEDEDIQGLMNVLQEGFQMQTFNSPVAHEVQDLVRQRAVEEENKRRDAVGGGSSLLAGRSGSKVTTTDGRVDDTEFAVNAAVMSMESTMEQLIINAEGLRVQFQHAQEELKAAQAQLVEAQKAQDTTEISRLTHEIEVAQAKIADLQDVLPSVEYLVGTADKPGLLYSMYNTYVRIPFEDSDAKIEATRRFNETLNWLFTKKWKRPDENGNLVAVSDAEAESLRRVVEMKMVRNPLTGEGSFAIFVPQVSLVMSAADIHGTINFDESVLKTLNGDHDGDTAVEIANTYFPPEQLANMRRGTQYVQRTTTEVLDENEEPTGEMKTGWSVNIGAPSAEAVYIEAFSDPLLNSELEGKVLAGLVRLQGRLFARYKKVLPAKAFRELLNEFQQNVTSNVTDARKILVQGMFALGGRDLLRMGDETGIPEALNIWNMISVEFDAIQQEFSYWRDINREQVIQNPIVDAVPEDSSVLKRVARWRAKTHGDAMMMLGSAQTVRPEQFLHYSALYNQAVELGMMDPEQMADNVAGQAALVELYAELGAGRTQSAMAEIFERNRIEDRVILWMDAIIDQSQLRTKFPNLNENELRMYVANLRVPAVVQDGGAFGVTGEQVSMAQMLLSRSLDIEAELQAGAPKDSAIKKKIATLRTLTRNNAEQGGNSNTAMLAFVEIFGDVPLYELMGKDSLYIGPHVTVRQLFELMLSMGEQERAAFKGIIKRAAPYKSRTGFGNPPWSLAVLDQRDVEGGLQMTSYTMLVDALGTAVSAEQKNRQTRSKKALTQFEGGLQDLSDMIDAWAKLFPTLDASDRVAVLNDMLRKGDQRVAKKIAAMVPKGAALGVVQLVDGQVVMQKWVEQALTEPDVKKAAAMWHINMLFAEWNVLQGRPSAEKIDADTVGTVRWSDINSRTLQTLYYLNTLNDGGRELRLFLETMARAESIEELYRQINNNPVWLAGRPELLPFDDDKSGYEVNTRNQWGAGNGQQEVLDAISDFAQMAEPMTAALVQRKADVKANTKLTKRMKAERDSQEKRIAKALNENSQKPTGQQRTEADIRQEIYTHGKDETAAIALGHLRQAIRNAQAFPDAVGPNAMQQLYTAMYDMFFRGHDKGLPPDLTRPMGEAITMADMFGFGNAIRAEASAITTMSWDQILTNPSRLVKGPVRIQLPDGRLFELDMSNEKDALDMLADPRTQEFAKLVLFPTMRDINAVGSVQVYSNGVQTGNIGQLLQDTSMASLFNPVADQTKLQQAYRYIGFVESYIRGKAVEEGTAQAWDEGFFPISNMISSFMIAYTTAEQVTEDSIDQVRDQLVLAVADTLKTMASADREMLPSIQELLSAELQKRFWGDSTKYMEFTSAMSDVEKQNAIDMTRFLLSTRAREERDRLAEQRRRETDKDLKAEIQRRENEAEAMLEHALNAKDEDLLTFRSRMEYKSVYDTFKLSHGRSKEQQDFDFVKKAAIVNFLGTQERINKFAGYKGKIKIEGGTEQNIYQLLAKFREMAWSDSGTGIFDAERAELLTTEQWDQLAEFCTTLTISERVVRSSDDTRVLPIILGTNVDELRKLYDTSWASLADPLFDDNVLDAVGAIAASTLDPTMRDEGVVVSTIVSNLYRRDRIGQWHDRIPMEVAKSRKLLDSASVEAAVQMEGVTNEAMDMWIANGFMTSEPVDLQQHTSTRDFVIDPTISLELEDYLDREAYIRIHNHAVSSVMLTPANGQPIDLITVGDIIELDESTRASDLRTLNLDVLIKHLAKNDLVPADGATLSITYVDVNKKPATPEYVNNVYFDGVGRASVGRSEVGLIASMLYAVNGVYGVGMQQPLDALTKVGQSFRAFKTSPLSRAKSFENAGTLTEMLEQKAMWLASQNYPTGRLTVDDIPALYKYIKSFHVVVGINPSTGRKEVWPAEKWIQYEAAGGPAPLVGLEKDTDPPKFVANSEAVTRALLGRAEYGVDRAYTDIGLVDPAAMFSPERLERLGLQNLGEEITGDDRMDTVLGQAPPATLHKLVDPKNRTNIQTVRQLRLKEWEAQQREQSDRRLRDYQILSKQNEENKRYLLDVVQAEQMGTKLAALGLPENVTQDWVNDQLNSSIAKSFKDLLGGSGILFVHRQGAPKGDTVAHLVAAQQVEDEFAGMTFPPTYGDGVLIELDSLLQYAGMDADRAFAEGLKVIKEYTKRGVAIGFISNTRTSALQQLLARELTEYGSGYTNLGNTGKFFMPSIRDEDYLNETIKALESTLAETYPQPANNFELIAWADDNAGLTENNRVIDPRYAKEWRRFNMLLVPSNFSVSVPGTNDLLLFGEPQKGTGETAQFNEIRRQLLAITEDGDPNSEGFKRLLKQMGSYPKNLPLYKKNPDGTTTPGVKPPEMALKDFLAALKLGEEIYEEGNTVMAGDLFIRVTNNGNVLIQRIGFELPKNDTDVRKLREQWQDQEEIEGTPFPKIRFAFSSPEPESEWTVPPPLMVERVDRTKRKLELTGLVTMEDAVKLHDEGAGFKSTTTIMDERTGFTSDLSNVTGNTRNISAFVSTEDISNKGSVRGVAHSFRNMFAITGWDVRQELMDVLVPDSVTSEAERLDFLMKFLNAWSAQTSGLTDSQILQLMDQERLLTTFLAELNEAGVTVMGDRWEPLTTDLEVNRGSALHNITLAVLATLASPNVTPDMVLSLPGFLTVQDGKPEAQIGFMPPLLSQLLNDPRRVEMRQYLLDKANSRFPTITVDGKQVPEHYFGGDLSFYARMYQTLPDGTQKPMLRKVSLQLVNAVAAEKNPVSYAWAFGEKRDISPFNSRITAAAYGGSVAAPRKGGSAAPTQQEIVEGDNKILRFDSDRDTVWSLVSRIMPKDDTYTPFKHLTALEHARLQATSLDMASYLHAIVRGDTDEAKAEWVKVEAARNKLLQELGLDSSEWVEIDFLVRQWYGTPGPMTDQTDYTEQVTPKMYLEAVAAMRENIAGPHRLHPLNGAMVPLEHVVFWRKVYNAGKWSPTKRLKKGKYEATEHDWGAWVEVVIGQMLDSHQEFMGMFLSPLDGFWQTYQGSTRSFDTISLSTQEKVAAKLMDADGNREYHSVDPDARTLMQDPAILASMDITQRLIAGHDLEGYTADSLRGIKVSEMSERIAYQKKWLRDNKVRPQKKKPLKDYSRQGAQYQESLRDSSLFLRGIVHLSITTRLFNPALWMSALGETFFRNQIENITNLVAGNNLSRGGKAASMTAEKMGIQPRFTPEELKKLDDLATSLGDSTEWIAELFGEMTYNSGLVEPGGVVDAEGRTIASGGWLSRKLERFATGTSRVMNDPRIGMSQKSAAIRYLSAAIEYLELSPNNVVSVDTFVAEMKKNPLWLKERFDTRQANPHQMGVNAVGNIRSQKNTVVAKLIMRPIETLCAQEGIGTWVGHALKIPFLFTRFNVNALTYLTGMTGMDQMLAMTLSGRESPWRSWFIRRRSEDPNLKFKPMDFNDAIETLDLSRLFVRGMVTQTGLFTLGMMGASLLGLGGEDEEEKRRRRQATYLGIPRVYDPQKASNDFRYQDAIFLDSIPMLGTLFKKDENGRSAVVPHWVMRQFTSPLMGVVRFFETGDIRLISEGFLDGISAIPNSVLNLYRDADLTAKLLQESAEADSRVETPEKLSTTTLLGISIVGMYEKALIENQFVNGIRSAFDRYDRNPWLVAMTNPEDGGSLNLQQGSNLPQQTDALQQYQREVPVLDDNGEPVLDDNGEVVMQPVSGLAYMTRSGGDAYLHQYAENNATAAVLLSLFTGQLGGPSSYARKNMVEKTVNVPINAVDNKTLESLVYARYFGAGGSGLLTQDDIGSILKTQAEARDEWWNQGDIDSQAGKLYKQQVEQFDALKAALIPQLEQRNAMTGAESTPEQVEAEADAMADAMMMGTSISKNGREELTLDGQEAMVKSLMAGMVTFDDPGFQGFYASQEQRDLLQARILDRIVQDGVNRGMTETAAKFRANRYYFGDSTDPSSPGLREILYSNKIPSKPSAEYNQLNASYVIGPDGKPWATPFPRQSIVQALGVPVPAGMIRPANSSMGLDERGNATDLVKNINTGRAALEPVQVEGQVTPNDSILDEIKKKTYTPKDTVAGRSSFGGFRRYGGGYSRGGYSRGGGGGGGFIPNSYITRMNYFTGMGAARIDNMPMINTNSPLIRRADVRRERVSSQRGRLKQWQ